MIDILDALSALLAARNALASLTYEQQRIQPPPDPARLQLDPRGFPNNDRPGPVSSAGPGVRPAPGPDVERLPPPRSRADAKDQVALARRAPLRAHDRGRAGGRGRRRLVRPALVARRR